MNISTFLTKNNYIYVYIIHKKTDLLKLQAVHINRHSSILSHSSTITILKTILDDNFLRRYHVNYTVAINVMHVMSTNQQAFLNDRP